MVEKVTGLHSQPSADGPRLFLCASEVAAIEIEATQVEFELCIFQGLPALFQSPLTEVKVNRRCPAFSTDVSALSVGSTCVTVRTGGLASSPGEIRRAGIPNVYLVLLLTEGLRAAQHCEQCRYSTCVFTKTLVSSQEILSFILVLLSRLNASGLLQ
ncbi:MAG: hypothetical protein Udaeo2_22420 [Candidatus Udaeobacter sp.]|nr:MAG: hypothetical protein Udaeo2_22420 [Candidatus Udaeobacter sp.]